MDSDAAGPAVGTSAPAVAGPAARTDTRTRVIDAAIDLTVSEGWPAITMARVARHAGVTRQTVYNEVGAKPALAEIMVLHELAAFIAVVESAFDDHPEDIVAAVHDATARVLVLSRTHPLLGWILSGEGTDLLPLVTTRAGGIHDAAVSTITQRLGSYPVPLDPTTRRRAVDTLVRVVLSHLVRPQGTAEQAADDVAWLADRLFASSV